MQLRSETGTGTEVSLFLPRTFLQPLAEPAKPFSESPLGLNARILVIDDDIGVRNFVVESLQDAGCHVTEAKHGTEGLEVLERDPTIEIVVVDYAMPSLDGVGFIEGAREIRPDLPIVLMTGFADAERLAETRLKVIPTILKPFTLDVLMTTLRQAMANRHVTARPSHATAD